MVKKLSFFDHVRSKSRVRSATAMIFGKKPALRGAGDREGERGKVQRPAEAGRGVRFGRGLQRKQEATRLPGRGNGKV